MGNPAMTSSMLSNVGTGLNAAAGVTAATGIGVPLAIGLAAVGTVTSIIAGILNNQAVDKANQQGLALANQQRADTLAQNKILNKQQNRVIGLNEAQFSFQKQEAGLNRGEKTEQTNHDRMKESYDNAVRVLNNQMTFQQNKVSPLLKRG